MSLPYSSRNGARIIWVCLHTAEGSRTRGSLYNFFDSVRSGSSHGGADGTGLDDGWVPDEYAAWTLLNGNSRSLNLEMCGFARWTRAQWLSTGTVDGVTNPRQMVRNAAEWARRKCTKYGIPMQRIGPEGVRAGRSGVIMHRDYTIGAQDGDHTDIGDGFPWDVFWQDVNGASSEGGLLSGLSPEYQQQIYDAIADTYERTGKTLGDGVGDVVQFLDAVKAYTGISAAEVLAQLYDVVSANYVASGEAIGKTTSDIEKKVDALTAKIDALTAALAAK